MQITLNKIFLYTIIFYILNYMIYFLIQIKEIKIYKQNFDIIYSII